ncbi:MAG TPA: YfiR family protein [Burkholderiales bacterium]|nr:YfiR family protein [Burkholderiales bacterium]
MATVIARLVCALILVFAAHFAGAADDSERALEQRVKAAYLYRFTEFIAWPDGAFAAADAPIVIAVAGASDGVAAELAQLTAGRTVGGRRIEVRRVTEAVLGARPVHLLFIPASERARIGQLARAAPKYAVLVTESEGALAQGSIINFVIVEGRVRFEVALAAAEKREVKLSARMLAVAQSVRSGP